MCVLLIMADQVFMYAIVAGVFVVLTGILLESGQGQAGSRKRGNLLLLPRLEKEKVRSK